MCDFWVKFLYNFENIQWFTSGIDASEIRRSLSNESLNIAPFCHKLVKVHLTNYNHCYKMDQILTIFIYCVSFCDIETGSHLGVF